MIQMLPVLTVKEVAIQQNVSTSTVRRWLKQGLPYYKIGNTVRIRQDELEKFLARFKKRYVPSDELLINALTSMPSFDKYESRGGKSKLAKKGQTCFNYGYGSVYCRKTKSGIVRWYIYYYTVEGKRKRRVVHNARIRDEAHAELKREILKVISDKNNGGQIIKSTIFKKFVPVYRKHIEANRTNFKSDLYRLKELVKIFGEIELRRLTPMMIEWFRNERIKAGNSRSTINRYCALLKRMLNLAIDEGYLDTNVMRKIRFYSEKDRINDTILNNVEEEKLLASSSERLRPLIIAALNTGMRKSELLNLEWRNVDFSKMIIKVEKTKSRKARFIPINSELAKTFNQLKCSKKDERVFPYKSIRTAWDNAINRAGLRGRGLTFHSLRHTFASRIIERGIDVEVVRSLLGHSSLLVTQRYTHARDERKRQAVEILVNLTHERHMGSSPQNVSLPNQLFSVN